MAEPLLVLDTDIGTDVDDALALSYLLRASRAPALVTTVHGDSSLRADIARRLIELHGGPPIAVVAGATVPLESSPVADFHWPPRLWGHEGVGLLAERRPPAPDQPAHDEDAAALALLRLVRAHPRRVRLLCVGPLTNLARALAIEPRLAELLEALVIMGGLIELGPFAARPWLDTNLNADVGASRAVFAARWRALCLVPLDVTSGVSLGPGDVARMRTSKDPLVGALVGQIEAMPEAWAAFAERFDLQEFFGDRTYLHDPLAAHVAIDGEGVTGCHVRLGTGMRQGAFRTWLQDADGARAWLCTGVDAAVFPAVLVERLLMRA